MSAVAGRARTLQLMLVLAAAIAVFAIAPSGAGALAMNSASFGATNPKAAVHSDVNISFTRNGTESEDLKEAIVELPPGMFANPEAVPRKCSIADFNADKCNLAVPAKAATSTSPALPYAPADSRQVGTLSVDIKAAGLLDLNIPGAVYVLEPNDTATQKDTATLGLVLRPSKICILFIFCAEPQKVFLQTNVKLLTFDTETGLKTVTSGAPRTTTVAIPPIVSASNGLKLDITINKMSLQFQGRAGKAKNGNSFMVSSTSCRPSIAKLTITSYTGGTAQSNTTAANATKYTPTSCSTVPFNPTFTFTPGSTDSGANTTAKFVMNVPSAESPTNAQWQQNAQPQIVDIDFPNESAVNLGALAGVTGCSEALLRADNCPASSVIGDAGAVAPYLPPALTGTVYAMDPINTAVPMAVVLRGARGTRIIFRGILGVRTPTTGPSRAYARFDAIPQLPYSQVTVNLAKSVYRNPNLSVCGPQTSYGHILGYNGSVAPNYTDGTLAERTASYGLTNCNQAPETTITNPPLSGGSDVTPTWGFQSSLPNSQFICTFDGGAPFSCNDNNTTAAGKTNGSYTAPATTAGSHTFTVYAINGVTQDATPASSTISIVTTGTITPTIVSTTTAPAAHPDIDFTADVSGGQPAAMVVRFPAGFVGSLKARPLCDTADAALGNCSDAPGGPSIGSVNLTLNTPTGTETGVGTAYLTTAPNAVTDAGGVSIKAQFSFGTFIAQAGAYLRNTGNLYYESLDIRSIPDNVNGTAVGVKQLKISFDGDTNRFLTNATSCAAGQFVATGTKTDGGDYPQVSTPYSSAGCGNLVPPFNPELVQTLTNPVAGDGVNPGLTGVVANVNVPNDNGSIKKFQVLEPFFLAPNFNAFGDSATDQCAPGTIQDTDPSAATNYVFVYSAASCPNAAKVGQMTINTPLLPNPLVGDVFLVARGSLPSFGVKFDQPGISVRLAGITRIDNTTCDDTLGCPDRIQVTFDNVPDTPVSSVVFALNNPDRSNTAGTQILSGKLLQTVQRFDPVCTSPQTADTVVTSWAGQTRTLTQPLSITGCDPQP